ncbi:conserved hypothetical protein [Mesorhizobium prunaredense]|uniref:JmjC domain-containing protein n=1 Tax=Mesorhizobium prunaredense TaxID=1631249 RepID=A0A1R3VCR1_9HYPH|nr:cupin domain-containing protein [Mesorhizobium prunaredense]SIT56170.1 conserved hypothetical protein [Mesorhizobium prunaredense]
MIDEGFSALGRLVGHQETSNFIARKLERAPHLSPRADTRALLSIDDIDRFFATIKYRTAECFCVDGNNPVDVSEFSSRGVVDSRKALRLFDSGATIVLNRVHLYHPALAEFCGQLSREFSAPCQANVYLTPPGSKGFNLHYDTHDVFMAQVAGSKRWRVYDSVFDLPLASQGSSARLEPAGDPVIETELSAGDVLYMPRGWSHEGTTTGTTSLHITFGVYFFTWADALIEAVSNRVLRDRKYRSSLPLDLLRDDCDPGDISRGVQDMLAAIASEVDVASLRRAFKAQFDEQFPDSTVGLLNQLVRAREITDLTKVRARVQRKTRVEPDGSLVIDVAGGTLRIADAGREAAFSCLSGRAVTVGSLSQWLAPDARIELVQRLIAAETVSVIA